MKVFTLQEANHLLPQVRDIMLKLRSAHKGLASMREPAGQAASSAEFGGGGMSGGARYVRVLETLAAKSREIDGMGVQIKDYERGLVDFPAMREGRVVLLCWHLGDGDEVTWWHDVDAGFAGRQPI